MVVIISFETQSQLNNSGWSNTFSVALGDLKLQIPCLLLPYLEITNIFQSSYPFSRVFKGALSKAKLH